MFAGAKALARPAPYVRGIASPRGGGRSGREETLGGCVTVAVVLGGSTMGAAAGCWGRGGCTGRKGAPGGVISDRSRWLGQLCDDDIWPTLLQELHVGGDRDIALSS